MGCVWFLYPLLWSWKNSLLTSCHRKPVSPFFFTLRSSGSIFSPFTLKIASLLFCSRLHVTLVNESEDRIFHKLLAALLFGNPLRLVMVPFAFLLITIYVIFTCSPYFFPLGLIYLSYLSIIWIVLSHFFLLTSLPFFVRFYCTKSLVSFEHHIFPCLLVQSHLKTFILDPFMCL